MRASRLQIPSPLSKGYGRRGRRATRRSAGSVVTRRQLRWQDTSRLYDRDNGKKPWRAEHPATDDEKEIGKAARDDILQRFPLATLNSKELVETHIAYLRDIVQTKGGHEAARARERLSATSAAQQQWLRMPVYQPDRRLAVQARERFVTYDLALLLQLED